MFVRSFFLLLGLHGKADLHVTFTANAERSLRLPDKRVQRSLKRLLVELTDLQRRKRLELGIHKRGSNNRFPQKIAVYLIPPGAYHKA